MADAPSSKKTTKELLLDAAFSFCAEPRYDTFSLHELAARVGISKPAIYRHFADKDALLRAMQERFTAELAGCLLAVQEGGATSAANLARIIRFFTENGCYVNYAISALSARDGFEREVKRELNRRGVRNLVGLERDAATGKTVISDLDSYVQAIYCGTTILVFIKMRERAVGTGLPVSDAADGAARLAYFLTAGLPASTGRRFPCAISEERMAELDALCALRDGDLPAQDRVFMALSAVVRKHKVSGVTVERIAAELSMAKSSLYEYFANKNEMIKTLILRELALMDTLIKENSVEARTFGEYIYVYLATEYAYLRLRPAIIAVCGWILTGTEGQSFITDFESTNPWQERITAFIGEMDVGFALTPADFVGWLGALPVALVMQCLDRELSDETLKGALRTMFRFVMQGIGEEAQPAG